MTIKLEEHAELLAELGEHASSMLNASWHEAARIFSPKGLEGYLIGAQRLKGLGKGQELVTSFIQSAPEIAREIGEDAVIELVQTVMMMASKTSGSVLELVVGSAPTAARRLGDEALFRGYLQLLNVLLAQAPRGLRPMLGKLDVLFANLTLGGLRRWANWGAHAHRTDYAAQVEYFGLESKESQAMLQKERKGTLFVDVQRRINMYLRALWARDFFMRPTSGDFENREGYKPYIEDYLLHLPDAYDTFEDVAGLEIYRAAAAHCAAHLVYTKEPLSAEGLNTLQMAVIGIIEDARVETLAIRKFPGLKGLWASLFKHVTPEQKESAGDYFNRLARALLDDSYEDDDIWIAQGRSLFKAAEDKLDSNLISWEIGVQLTHLLQEKKLGYSPRRDVLTTPYRDDNRYFWQFVEFDQDRAEAAGYDQTQQVRKYVNVMEMANEIDTELAGDDAQEIWVLGSELFPYEDMGVSFNDMEGKEPISEPFHYPEWDYQIQLERPAWATVLERRAKAGDLNVIDEITGQNKRIISRMKFLLDAMQPQGVTRIRKLEDGDDIDINAAIASLIDMRMGQSPDPRIMMRSVRKVRDISVMVLLDLSESTNDKVTGQDFSVLDLTRQATVLLADAISKVGDPFAIHGFSSDGRHDVQYLKFKDFDQPYDEHPKARLAGMTGQLSTRMGAAMRHAGHYLRQQKSTKKLMIVITDGEPADIDVRDPQYLRYDAKKAVEELSRSGIITYCMSLDPRADQYVSRIFGARNYMVVDHVERLPEKLPLLYAGLTR